MFETRTFPATSPAAKALFGAIGAAPAATSPQGGDAEIIALSAEVLRRREEAEAFQAARIDPFNERVDEIFWRDTSSTTEAVRWKAACAYSKETGREDAIEELREFDEAADEVFYRMMAIPATTQQGRAAKVRALLVHVMGDDWRGPAKELEWDIEHARALLGELAGMTAEELDHV
jgi:hypothetical protein